MEGDDMLADRYGLTTTHRPLLLASLVAAHGASGKRAGFGAADVRFFFYLFANWLEKDVALTTPVLELTQVRRMLRRLVLYGWARTWAEPKKKGARFAVTPEGLVALAEALASSAASASFEEGLFIVCFAACYREPIVARAPEGRRALLERLLSPSVLLSRIEARLERIVLDLDERVRSSAAMHAEAERLRGRGAADAAVARALDRHGAYQLQHVRPLGEVMADLPADVLSRELASGIAARSRLIFAPMADVARAQKRVLYMLRTALLP